MPTRRVLLVLLLLVTPAFAEEEAEYVYDLKPGWSVRDERGWRIVFEVRQEGEPRGQMTVIFPPSCRWFPMLVEKMASDDFLYSYFRARTKAPFSENKSLQVSPLESFQMPGGRRVFKGGDVFTMEPVAGITPLPPSAVPSPMAKPPLPHSGTDIFSLEEITQNQYLNVSPRKVPVPEDAK